ncbi:MAG: precorrin-3B C(17)-methyltransferase [Lachnospiraceae bacterium]|nr:precorrin-3B C(17)-methyltransferase [Lachnospiraceae bacterium]
MKGNVFVVGTGPGDMMDMTYRAREALSLSDLICGYPVYVDLIRDLYPDKEYYVSGMGQELERCEYALRYAQTGCKTVSVISSGDSGIYGMAGPVLELSERYGDVEIEIVPGITAAISAASVLGAPIMNDYVTLSLSDLMTPFDVIMRRLKAAAEGDFVICIYNPMSRKRRDHLKIACDLLMEYKSSDTVCGYVQNIGRSGENAGILSLRELRDMEADMFTTIIVGSADTYSKNGRMITGRGYRV